MRPEEADWEGAAERLLHGFALSLLVPDEQYTAVSDWINDHHLGTRLVYYRVPAASPASPGSPPQGNLLSAKLEIKDSRFYPWLERELDRRAGYECVPSMTEFRRAARAITKAGQIKGGGGRHEKDDRHRIDDRSTYVLGWTNERKVETLLRRAAEVQRRQSLIADDQEKYQGWLDLAVKRGNALAGLAETTEFAEIDWQSLVSKIESLAGEKRTLQRASKELERLTRELERVQKDIEDAEVEQEKATGAIGSLGNEIETAYRSLEEADAVLSETRLCSGPGAFRRHRGRLAKPPLAAIPLDSPARLRPLRGGGPGAPGHGDRQAERQEDRAEQQDRRQDGRLPPGVPGGDGRARRQRAVRRRLPGPAQAPGPRRPAAVPASSSRPT